MFSRIRLVPMSLSQLKANLLVLTGVRFSLFCLIEQILLITISRTQHVPGLLRKPAHQTEEIHQIYTKERLIWQLAYLILFSAPSPTPPTNTAPTCTEDPGKQQWPRRGHLSLRDHFKPVQTCPRGRNVRSILSDKLASYE